MAFSFKLRLKRGCPSKKIKDLDQAILDSFLDRQVLHHCHLEERRVEIEQMAFLPQKQALGVFVGQNDSQLHSTAQVFLRFDDFNRVLRHFQSEKVFEDADHFIDSVSV